MNQFIFLRGRLGRDPEIKTAGGAQLAVFSIATKESYKKNDEWVDKSTWHDVKAWRKLAEQAEALSKGDLVIVTGKYEKEEWETKDGDKRSRMVVVASSIDKVVVAESKPKNAHGVD